MSTLSANQVATLAIVFAGHRFTHITPDWYLNSLPQLTGMGLVQEGDITPKGVVWLKAAMNLPLPVETWSMPPTAGDT